MREPNRAREALRIQSDSNPDWLACRYEFLVDRSGGPDACHPWLGRLNMAGYGVLSISSRWKRAHRVGYELLHGEIGEGLQVCHRCDNRDCQNDRHWFLGTNAENQADMRRKGRGVPPPRIVGEKHHHARLTSDQVAEIRRRYSGRHGEKAAFAREYGVSNTTIGLVVSGRRRQWG